MSRQYCVYSLKGNVDLVMKRDLLSVLEKAKSHFDGDLGDIRDLDHLNKAIFVVKTS